MADSTKVQATDYKLQFNGTDWTITRSDKTSFTMAPDASGNLSFDGLSVNVTGRGCYALYPDLLSGT